jgi:uncharacterized protein
MDERTADKVIEATHWPRMMAATALGVLALFLLVATIKVLKEYRFVGSGVTATNTITVSGMGEVFAVPDLAMFSVTVQEEAKEVKPAQEKATEKNNAIVAYLKQQGVDEKDIQTADYSVYPQYDYKQASCREGYCPPSTQTLRGYQVSQTLTIKVRDTEKAGELLSGVGTRGATSVSGLSFTIDDEDALKAEARQKAIEEAREKAEELADQLGVSIVRVVGFNEDGSYPPMPYAARGAAFDMAVAQESKAVPDLPMGQNKIISNVNISYEIR